jgi:hypothetical protein
MAGQRRIVSSSLHFPCLNLPSEALPYRVPEPVSLFRCSLAHFMPKRDCETPSLLSFSSPFIQSPLFIALPLQAYPPSLANYGIAVRRG